MNVGDIVEWQTLTTPPHRMRGSIVRFGVATGRIYVTCSSRPDTRNSASADEVWFDRGEAYRLTVVAKGGR